MTQTVAPSGHRRSQPTASPPALVLNVGLAGLGAIRSLGRAGITVYGLDPDPTHVGFASRYCTPRPCPHPVRQPDELLRFLLAESERIGEPAVLSPASDAFVLFLSRHRDALRDRFLMNLPGADLVEAGLDKRGLYDLADRHGVDHADTHYPETIDDVLAIRHELAYPVYIKPYESHLWQLAFPETVKGIKVFDADQLVASFHRILPTGTRVMIQSIIAGPATNIRSVRVYIDQHGELRAAMTNRKIRQFPTEFGRATLAETTHDPALLEVGLRFFRDIDFRGFGLIEFKQDDHDGLLKLTDLNPRWLKTVNLATSAGIDFPLMHYRDLAGRPMPPQFAYRAGVRWLDAAGDLGTAWPRIRAGDLTPSKWARSLVKVRSFASFAADDWRPFLREYQYGRRLLRIPGRLRQR